MKIGVIFSGLVLGVCAQAAPAVEADAPPVGADLPQAAGGLPVVLTLSLSDAGFGHMGHIEIFIKDDLVLSTNWLAGDCWVPTHGRQTVYWTDPASSNLTQRFYFISEAADTDGDGHSDLYEAWVGRTDSNSFDAVNSDLDEYNDWLEEKIFGDLAQTGSDDFDGDGLLNCEELFTVSASQPAVMLSDPALADSDCDLLSDFEERREYGTDALNPDTDSDGRDDAAELLGSPPTDPHNPDTSAPVLVLTRG